MGIRERVYGSVDFNDGVLGGVADFHGRPHAFELDGDPYAECPIYRLAPIRDLSATAWREGCHDLVDIEAPVRARGRFSPRDDMHRGDDGPWALDVEWIEG